MLTELTDCARARSSKTLKHLRKTLPLEQEIQPSEHLALGLGLYERLYGQNIEGTTAGELLSRVETGATALVNAMAAELVHRGESIPEAIRRAVLRRALEPGPGRLPALPWNPMACAEAFLLHLLLLWPGVRVPPWETTWTQGAAMVHGDDGIRQMAEAAQREFERIHDEGWYKIQEKKGWGRVACWAPLLYLAERELEQDRRRPICAVPANVEHHDLVSGWKDAPWQGKPERECFADDEEERIALFTHERIQLQLPFKELQNELVRVMREVHQAEGLR
ncbi:hypothetical protein KKE60_08975, partial [Patescibacteria group bacterium]|nr:hypothetical protein [Patescibacteria group bacterium]